MPKKWRARFLLLCVIATVGGAIGVLALGDRGGDVLLVVSALALILGIFVFLFHILWRLAREGVTPLSPKQNDTVDASARATGEAFAHVLLGKLYPGNADAKTPATVNVVLGIVVGSFVGGCAAAGLAKLIVEEGAIFWLVTGVGITGGAIFGFLNTRSFLRAANEKPATQTLVRKE